MGGVGDVPQVFESLPLRPFFTIVKQGESYPQQWTEGVEKECLNRTDGKALVIAKEKQLPAAERVEDKPQKDLPAPAPVFCLVKYHNKEDVLAPALGKVKPLQQKKESDHKDPA